MKVIDLEIIKRSKSVLMGFAILWIIAYHYQLGRDTIFIHFTQIGNLGVDIFILLSSFSLCFSLSKDSNYIKFIKRRFLRIIPTWWFLITFLLIINYLINRNTPTDFFQHICYYSGLGWWFYHNEPFGTYYYEWYIPTLLVFYLFAPLLYELSKGKILTVFVISIICVYLLLFLDIDKRLSLSYLRIPTFIYGVILYKIYKKEFDINNSLKYLLVSSILNVIIFPLIVYKCYELIFLAFMFAMPVLLTWLCLILRGHLKSFLSFIGTLTLELYLLHIYELPLIPMIKIVNNRSIAIILTTTVLIVVCFFINYLFRTLLYSKFNQRK